MSFYAPWYLLFLLGVIPVILLYLLKQKYEKLPISSLYLWQKALQHTEAKSPWQKLRSNVLLLLQMLLMLLLAFALAEPYLKGQGDWAMHQIVLMDTSLSMAATDVAPSRWDAAMQKAIALVKGFQPGTRITLLGVAGEMRMLADGETSKAEIIKKLEALAPTYEKADFSVAENWVKGRLKEQPQSQVSVFSDGVVQFSGIDTKLEVINGEGANFAISDLIISKRDTGMIAVCSLSSFAKTAALLPVSLYADDRVWDAKSIALLPGESKQVYWQNIPGSATRLVARIDHSDALVGDNLVYGVPSTQQTLRALLYSSGNVFLQKVFSVSEGVELYVRDPKDSPAAEPYDILLYDGIFPNALPPNGALIFINPPDNSLFAVKGSFQPSALLRQEHPFTQYISDASFSILRAREVLRPLWARPVLSAQQGDLLFTGENQGRSITVFTFDLKDSDFALKPMFPVLFSNMIAVLKGGKEPLSQKNLAGTPLVFNYQPQVLKYKITSPQGKVGELRPELSNRYPDTQEKGFYAIEAQYKDGSNQSFYTAVNGPGKEEGALFSKVVHSKDFGMGPIAEDAVNPNLDLKWIVLCVLLLLFIVEWGVYLYGH